MPISAAGHRCDVPEVGGEREARRAATKSRSSLEGACDGRRYLLVWAMAS
jgi:hypothetical protein